MKKLILALLLLPTLAFAQQNLTQGGTGWSTSTKGDLLVGTSSTLRYTRLPVGSTGNVLWVSGGQPAWVSTSSLGFASGGEVTYAYASSTFPSFSYASSTYYFASNPSGYITTGYASSTFPSFSYGSSTYATSTGLYANFMTYLYGSSTFPSFSYGSSTYLTSASATSTYVPYTGATTNVNLNAKNLTNVLNLISTNASSTNLTVNGTSVYQAPLSGTSVQFVGVDGSPFRASLDTYQAATTFGSQIQFRRARGTGASPTAVQLDDTLGSLGADGYGTTGFHTASVGNIAFRPEGTFTDISAPTYIAFYTTATGTVLAREVVRIQSDGTLLATSSILTNATTTNGTTTNFFATNATATRLFATNGTTTRFFTDSGTSTLFASVTAILTNSTSTNLFSTNATTTRFFTTTGGITNFSSNLASTTALTVGKLYATSSAIFSNTTTFFNGASTTGLTATNIVATGTVIVSGTSTFATNVGIGTTTFPTSSNTNPELVKIDIGTNNFGQQATPLSSYCNSNGVCQIAVTNINASGNSVESGFTAQNASSTATTTFGWFGINGPMFSTSTTYSTGTSSDVVFIGRGNDLYLANSSTTGSIIFQLGGTGLKSSSNTKAVFSPLGNFGLGTTSPIVSLSVATGSVAIFPYLWGTATSTTMTVDWKRSNNQTMEISTSAVTINMVNATSSPGQKLILNVCNAPTGTAGAITWSSSLQIRWINKTTPTQTTTANNCDKYSFDANYGTSSQVIIYGGQNANF